MAEGGGKAQQKKTKHFVVLSLSRTKIPDIKQKHIWDRVTEPPSGSFKAWTITRIQQQIRGSEQDQMNKVSR